MDQMSDEQLMSDVMAGDRESFAILVTRHHAPLLGYLYRLVSGDLPLAEDLVQETLVHVLQQYTFKPDRPFKPWLYMVATNLARDHFRSATARHRLQRSDEEEMLLQLPDAVQGPEESVLASEQGNEVRTALAQLNEEYRIVVILRFYQEFSLQEIAEALQIPLGTVKSRLFAATRRLQSLLTPIQNGVH